MTASSLTDVSGDNRKGYSMLEKKNILKYIIDKNGFSEVKGRRFWVEFADSGKTNRTWQSLKEVFIKRIIPDLRNPYFGLPNETIQKFCSGANTNTKNLLDWTDTKRKDKPPSSAAGPSKTSAPVTPIKQIKKDDTAKRISPSIEINPDSSTDIELASIRVKATPTSINIEDSDSISLLIPSAHSSDLPESPVIFSEERKSSQNAKIESIEIQNTDDMFPPNRPEKQIFQAIQQIDSPENLKRSLLLLDSDDSSDLFSTEWGTGKKMRKNGNMFGFSTGKPVISNKTPETSRKEFIEYHKTFQPSCSKTMDCSTPSKHQKSIKKFKEPLIIDSSTTDCESDTTSDSSSEYVRVRSKKKRGQRKGQQMFCSLNGKLFPIYKSKNNKCAERQKIYTQFREATHNLQKKKKTVYLDHRDQSPVKQSKALVSNENSEKIDPATQEILNFWKMKYIAEKKRVNYLFRILSSEQSAGHSQSQTEKPLFPPSTSGLIQSKELSSSKLNGNQKPSSSNIVSATQLQEEENEKLNFLTVKYSKEPNSETSVSKIGTEKNVLLIDTQKANVLFDLLKKLTESNVENDNTNNKSPRKANKRDDNSCPGKSEQNNAKQSPTKDMVKPQDSENYGLRTRKSKTPLISTPSKFNEPKQLVTPNKVNQPKQLLTPNKVNQPKQSPTPSKVNQQKQLSTPIKTRNKIQKEEIDKIFDVLEAKKSPSMETKGYTPAVKSIREKEKKIFEKILSEDLTEETNVDRQIFTSSELKMLLKEDQNEASNVTIGKNNKNTNDSKNIDGESSEKNSAPSPKKRGRKKKSSLIVSPVLPEATKRSLRSLQASPAVPTKIVANKEIMTRRSHNQLIDSEILAHKNTRIQNTQDNELQSHTTQNKRKSGDKDDDMDGDMEDDMDDEVKFKINPKFFKQIFPSPVKVKRFSKRRPKYPVKTLNSSDSEQESPRYAFPDPLSINLAQRKSLNSFSKPSSLKSNAT